MTDSITTEVQISGTLDIDPSTFKCDSGMKVVSWDPLTRTCMMLITDPNLIAKIKNQERALISLSYSVDTTSIARTEDSIDDIVSYWGQDDVAMARKLIDDLDNANHPIERIGLVSDYRKKIQAELLNLLKKRSS